MIYFLSKKQTFYGSFEGNLIKEMDKQFEILSNLLIEFHDQIAPFFGKDFERHKVMLLHLQKEYNDNLLENYMKKTTRGITKS
jgi:hypothetical protein